MLFALFKLIVSVGCRFAGLLCVGFGNSLQLIEICFVEVSPFCLLLFAFVGVALFGFVFGRTAFLAL